MSTATEKQAADTNFCVDCNEVCDFYADSNHSLYCMKCGWPLDEAKATQEDSCQ